MLKSTTRVRTEGAGRCVSLVARASVSREEAPPMAHTGPGKKGWVTGRMFIKGVQGRGRLKAAVKDKPRVSRFDPSDAAHQLSRVNLSVLTCYNYPSSCTNAV